MGDDPVEALRKRLGIADERQRPRAGAIGPGTFKARAEAYAEEMRRLHEGGADYSGRGEWQQAMTRLGRR